MAHITLIVAKGHRAEEIGPMITRLKGLPRQYLCQVRGQNLYRMEENEEYMWEQPHVDSVAVFERINKLPFREMLLMMEQEDLLAQVPKEYCG